MTTNSVRIMPLTLTLDLPEDLQEAAQKIGDLKERVESYVEQQVAFEQWQAKQYSPSVQAIAEEAERQAAEMRKTGFDRQAEGQKFLEVWDKLAASNTETQ